MSSSSTAARTSGSRRPVPGSGPAARDQPPAELTDPAAAALDGPGSTSVSCLLMQDVIAAEELKVAVGRGSVALFANPYRKGKEEALVVDSKGRLTYLERAGAEADTGWRQTPVTGGGAAPIAAAEVVVVQHPQDLTMWAIVSNGASHTPQALRLVAVTEGGVTTCTWKTTPRAIRFENGRGAQGVSHMSVSYDGRVPHLTCLDTASGEILAVKTALGQQYRFASWSLSDSVQTGTVATLVGGVVTASHTQAPPIWDVAYALVGGKLTRYTFAGTAVPIASDVKALVGTYRSFDWPDIGCIYLNTGGQLVTWNLTQDRPDGQYTYNDGVDLDSASSWVDADGMVHIYGLRTEKNADGTTSTNLKVLHQASWGPGGIPVWSRSVGDYIVWSLIGLVRGVTSFVLDPFPDALPSQLVKAEGTAAAGDLFSIHVQDVTAARWTRERVRLPDGSPQLVSHYVSAVTVLDRRGRPMAALPVTVTAETLVEIQVEGSSYLVGPGHAVSLRTNQTGKITIATAADSLLPPTLHVDAAGLEHGAVVQPAAAVHEYLAGTGTLPSQQGLFNGTALKAATADGQPIVGPGHAVAACDGVVAATGNVFQLAAGKPMTSKLHSGPGPAPRIHGFAIGSALSPQTGADAGKVVYTEFADAAEAAAHAEAIRATAQYVGSWDDFVNWVGDVWEGIKDGVVKVAHVLVDAVTTVFIQIGKAVVGFVGLVVDTVATAVRVVEAVITQVVDGVIKVVHWLTSLFDLKDIWQTKQALESGLHTMLMYGGVTVSQLGKGLHNWFAGQEAQVTKYFENLKQEYATQPLGDGPNRVPPLADHSGHVIAPHDLRDSPQANWLLERVLAEPAQRALRAGKVGMDLDPAITTAWDDFIQKVHDSKIADDLSAAIGDLGTLLGLIIDPGDPAQAAKAAMGAVIDALERVVLIALKAMDLCLQAAIGLVTAVVGGLDRALRAELPLGPVNTLYEWIQTQAGVATPDKLSLGGILCLIAGFMVTTGYKLVKGVDQTPFPQGFPAIPPPPWMAPLHPGHNRHAADPGASHYDNPVFTEQMKALKAACGLMGSVGSFTNAAADMGPLLNYGPDKGPLVAGTNALFGASTALFLTCPPVNGKPWDSVPASGAFAVACLNAACAWGTLILNIAQVPLVDHPAFKNVGQVEAGPILVTILSSAQLGFALAGDPPNGYVKANLVLGALPGMVQFLRYGIEPEYEFDWYRAAAVAAFDLLSGATAGLMTAVPAFIAGPDIPAQPLPTGKVGQPFTYTVVRTNERAYNVPFTWSFTGKLPRGLDLDPVTGVVSGIPTESGTSVCDITCKDSYAPPQYASRTGFAFTINP